MAQPPIVRDFAFIKSSVPFPSADNNQEGAPHEHHRQRTGSNSSSSSSSALGPHQSRPPAISMSGRTQKQLSPVAEECEDSPSRQRFTSGRRADSRVGRRPRRRTTSRVGHANITAERLTVEMLSMTPRSPPRKQTQQTKAATRHKSTGKPRSRFQKFRQSIRKRLPTIGSVWRVLRRS